MGRLMSTLCPASQCVQNCHCLSGEKKTQPCPMAEKGEINKRNAVVKIWGRTCMCMNGEEQMTKKKEKGKLLIVLSLFIALRKTFKLESKLECQQADTKTLISSV